MEGIGIDKKATSLRSKKNARQAVKLPLPSTANISQPSAKSNTPDEKTSRRKTLPDTTESVGKATTQYTPKLGDKIFTTKTRTYIETVDELYGIETYLRKVGKMKKDNVDALKKKTAPRIFSVPLVYSLVNTVSMFFDAPKGEYCQRSICGQDSGSRK